MSRDLSQHVESGRDAIIVVGVVVVVVAVVVDITEVRGGLQTTTKTNYNSLVRLLTDVIFSCDIPT